MVALLNEIGRRLARRDIDTLRERVVRRDESLALLSERLAELEFAIEDREWERLSAESRREFSRKALAAIVDQARAAYLKNPLIKRSVKVKTDYVFSLGINIVAKDPALNDVVQAIINDPDNQVEVFSHQARLAKEDELQVEGNLFFVFFTNPKTGRTKLRTIPVDEIADIITNPDDAKEPWYYKRVYQRRVLDTTTGQTRTQEETVWHPCYRYRPVGGWPDVIGGKRVVKAPIFHVKVGGFSHMRFGVPEVYAALDWSKAHKSFLEDWATIVKSYARFAWRLTTRGGLAGVKAVKDKLATTLGLANQEKNPAPTAGSILISSEGQKVEPIRTQGATTAAADGRYLLLQVAAAVGLPETFFGDTQSGTLATARSLDRPTELAMHSRQQLWAWIITTILGYALEEYADANAAFGFRYAIEDDREVPVWPAELDRRIDVTFPDILERDVDAIIRAIVQFATLDGKGLAGTIDLKTLVRLGLEALGVPNVNELIQLYFDGQDEKALLPPVVSQQDQMKVDRELAQARTQQGGGNGQPNRSDSQGDQR